MFYTPVWEFDGYQLVARPDTPNYFIYWTPRVGPGRSPRARRKSTRTSDLDTARRRLIEFAEQQSRARPTKRSPEATMLLDVLSDYCVEQDRRVDHYYPASRTVLKHVVKFAELFGVETVADFGLDAQQAYIEWRRQRLRQQGFAASNGTLNRELGVVKAAFRFAWKRGKLERHPHIELLPSPPPRDRFLRAHEARRLLAACEPSHLKLYVMLALHTLQRPIAIMSLRNEQVDLERGRIDFLPPGGVQSNKRRPVVPITPSLRPELQQAILGSQSGYVVEYKGRPVRSVKRSFAAACEAAGLANVTPYALRHTGATLMAASGVPLRQIAGMLGHTEARTTEIYAKHHPDFLQDAANAIESLFGGGGGENG